MYDQYGQITDGSVALESNFIDYSNAFLDSIYDSLREGTEQMIGGLQAITSSWEDYVFFSKGKGGNKKRKAKQLEERRIEKAEKDRRQKSGGGNSDYAKKVKERDRRLRKEADRRSNLPPPPKKHWWQ